MLSSPFTDSLLLNFMRLVFFSSFELVLINATHNYKELLLFIVVVKFQTHLRAAPKQKNNN